jgi:hypothetical protein
VSHPEPAQSNAAQSNGAQSNAAQSNGAQSNAAPSPAAQPYGAARIGAVVLAGGALGYGLYELVAASPSSTRPFVAAQWLAGVLVVHDAVLAPVAVLVGWALTRRLPPRARRGVAVALFVGGCLALVALPVLLSPSAVR